MKRLLIFVTFLLASCQVMALPDVVVTDASYYNGVFTSTVKNQGADPTPTITIGVRYTVDGVARASGSVGMSLAAGASVTIGTTTPYIIPDGSHSIDYYVDDINRFAESNETNNHLIIPTIVDTTAPTVSITAPAAGTVSGSVQLSATATDAQGVIGVQYKLDGVSIGQEDTVSPFNVTWDSTTTTNAAHSITAVARDSAGNTATSAAVSITVNNAAPLPDVIVTSSSYSNGIFTSVVKNQGTAPVPNVTLGVRYSVDGVARASGSVPGNLAAGASVTIGTTTPYVIPSGTHSIDNYVDDINRFAESNETNNHLIAPITISTSYPTGAAYPGAQGGGAQSIGGRGGVVIPVTTLADSGAGSLRACLTDARPRICVFKVGGTITLQSEIYISNSYLTVAGQTAPGGGILISGKGNPINLITIAAHDVIWQYTRFRKGYSLGCADNNTTECGATIAFYSRSYNVMFDHNSLSWNQDEGIGLWDATSTNPRVKNNTMSYNLLAEGLASHSTGIILGGATGLVDLMENNDIHHNLTMNNSHRNPLIEIKSSRHVSNIYYNQNFYLNQLGGGIQMDIINNKYKQGAMTNTATHEVQMFEYADILDHLDTQVVSGSPSVYMSGNVGYHTGAQWNLTAHVSGENGSEIGAAPTTWQRATPLPTLPYPITETPVASLDAVVIPEVGASRKLDCNGAWVANRDAVDTRLINQYTTNTGISTLPVNEDAVGGFPVIANGTPCADADADGMFDAWESANGLNPASAADANFISANGYRNIENFLTGTPLMLVMSDPTTQLVSGCGVMLDNISFDAPLFNNACAINIGQLSAGQHTIKSTFYNVSNNVRNESVFSTPLTFTTS